MHKISELIDKAIASIAWFWSDSSPKTISHASTYCNRDTSENIGIAANKICQDKSRSECLDHLLYCLNLEDS